MVHSDRPDHAYLNFFFSSQEFHWVAILYRQQKRKWITWQIKFPQGSGSHCGHTTALQPTVYRRARRYRYWHRRTKWSSQYHQCLQTQQETRDHWSFVSSWTNSRIQTWHPYFFCQCLYPDMNKKLGDSETFLFMSGHKRWQKKYGCQVWTRELVQLEKERSMISVRSFTDWRFHLTVSYILQGGWTRAHDTSTPRFRTCSDLHQFSKLTWHGSPLYII